MVQDICLNFPHHGRHFLPASVAARPDKFYALRTQTWFEVRNSSKDMRKFGISAGVLVTRFGGTGKREPVGL
jgi:hypothetical protein